MEKPSASHNQMVGLLLSWNCPALCRHCGYSCSPHYSRVMTESEGKSIIDCARQLPFTESIAFAGGEPFLHFPLLVKLCRYAHSQCGYVFTISTNAFWATSRPRATRMLDQLAELGLRVLLVSVDDFHQEFVPLERVENCVNAALELGIECNLQTIVTRKSRKTADFKQLLKIPQDSTLVKWHENPCNPTGRAEQLSPSEDLILEWKNQPGCCSMLKTWIVDPYGGVSPCCGIPFGRLLDLGDAFKEGLTEIVRRANVNPFLNALAAYGGPFILIELLARKGCSKYAQMSYTSNCHACQTLFRDKEALNLIAGDLNEHWLELLTCRTLVHEQQGPSAARNGSRMKDVWVPEPWYRTPDPQENNWSRPDPSEEPSREGRLT